MAAERLDTAPRRRTGVRVRTTMAAVLIVGIVVMIGAAALVLVVRVMLLHGLESTAETRADAVASEIEATGPIRSETGSIRSETGSRPEGSSDKGVDRDGSDHDEPDHDDPDPEDLITEVHDPDGTLISTTDTAYRLPAALVGAEADAATLPGGSSPFVIRSADATWQGTEYTVTVAISREDLDDATSALLPALGIGIPGLLIVVAGTIWLVVGRALAPVEQIRSQVATITDERLDQRVPLPGSRDEIGRLAGTMNQMLARLERSHVQQQRFVSDASHELRSPIATLRQSAEVAARHSDAFEPGEFVEIVGAEALRMQRLVEQLLVLSRADEGRADGGRALPVEDVDLDDLALTEADRIRRQGSGLVVDVSGVSGARVRGSRAAWSQVLRNLVDNAARHAHSQVSLRVRQQGDQVHVVVDDDGSGVAPSDRERVFERFVRLDDARARDTGGSGLGLAIVRELVHAAGGRVAVLESPGGGARFLVEAPVDPHRS